ncbi:MAG: XdhC family protein, partial [Bacteroidota bacterium]
MDIFREILDGLKTQERVMLATIIATSGSTPASAFSRMLVRNKGTVSIGTVGGGCMEADVLEAAKRLYDADRAEILTFHLNEDEFVQGLICGGSVDVFVEPITRDHLTLLEQIQRWQEEGEDCVLATFLANNGAIGIKHAVHGTDGMNRLLDYWKTTIHQSSNPPILLEDELQKCLRRHETRRITTPEGDLILEPIAGTPSLIIFGGGHVSRYVCQAAAMAGFRVTVVDDRREYANAERFPEAAQTIAIDFSASFGELSI